MERVSDFGRFIIITIIIIIIIIQSINSWIFIVQRHSVSNALQKSASFLWTK